MEEKSEQKFLVNGGYPLHTFEEVKESYSTYIHNEESRALIEKAYDFVCKKHAGIYRKSGEPYIHHLIEVAYIIASLQAGPVTIASGLLHDVVEDTDTTIEDIEKMFGSECAKIVDALTKIQRLKLSHRTQEEFEAEDRRKIFLGMAKDVRVILIKLADRLHNMRTIASLKEDRQHALAQETLEVFAPIAHRLGIYRIESELEDLSLKIIEPEKYNEIMNALNKKVTNRKKALDKLKIKIANAILEKNITFEIESRVKSIYSIYKKMYIKNYSFDEIYDVLALRIITETEINCYEILGIIHAEFKPIPGRFKDYIAVPKPNMYQSLHTSIIAGDGNVFEVQIRTKEMDEIAETGVAAHWRYKEGVKYNAKKEQEEIEERLHWFRDFVSMSDNNDESAKDYMENLTKDVFEANVYVFTPKGKVIDLPNGSTPVGEQAVGALVNGALVPLSYVLKTGDVVDIKTSKSSAGPNEGWLNFVRTNNAKNNIKKFLTKKNNELLKEDKIKKARQIIADFCKDYELNEEDFISQINTENVLNNYQCKTFEDLLIAICNKNVTLSSICDLLKIKRQNVHKLNLSNKAGIENDEYPVYAEGASGDLQITLGACCSPIPGDEIIGYVTKGKGITVHRCDCNNVKNLKNRLINVYWKENIDHHVYPVNIICECYDRANLLIDIINTLSANKVKVTEVSAKMHPETLTSSIFCQIYVSNFGELQKIFNSLKNVRGVYNIKRQNH